MTKPYKSERTVTRERILAAHTKLENVWPHTLNESDRARLSEASSAIGRWRK